LNEDDGHGYHFSNVWHQAYPAAGFFHVKKMFRDYLHPKDGISSMFTEVIFITSETQSARILLIRSEVFMTIMLTVFSCDIANNSYTAKYFLTQLIKKIFFKHSPIII